MALLGSETFYLAQEVIMSISLRIVGIFYNNTVDLGPNGGTVKDVLDASVASPGVGQDFYYQQGSVEGLASPSTFLAQYGSPFTSPISGLNYPAGSYQLQENLTGYPSYTVWQYYLFDQNNVFLNRGKGPIAYDTAAVFDGQSVVWRLLTILAVPTPIAPRLARPFAKQAAD
jgi:hypothetical protein